MHELKTWSRRRSLTTIGTALFLVGILSGCAEDDPPASAAPDQISDARGREVASEVEVRFWRWAAAGGALIGLFIGFFLGVSLAEEADAVQTTSPTDTHGRTRTLPPIGPSDGARRLAIADTQLGGGVLSGGSDRHRTPTE